MTRVLRFAGDGPLGSALRHFAPGLALAALFLGGCEEKNAYVAPPPPKVTVATPQPKTVTDYLEFTGNTQAISTVKLVARVEGYLDKQHFQDGADVRKGDLLFTIQPDQFQAQLQQAQASVLDQKAALEHAETEFDRYSRLYQQKAAAATDVDNWRYQRDAAKAGLANAEAQVALAKLNIDYTQVTAPFNGRMGRHLVDTGNVVGNNQALAEINQIDPIYAYFTINERDLLRARGERRQQGATDYRAHPIPAFLGLANEVGYPHEGRIDFTAISVDPNTGTLLLRAVFPNSDRVILPGLFGRIRVPVAKSAGALVVPQVAIGTDQIGHYVLIVDDKNTVERRGVELGIEVDDNMQVIDAGLKGDERVIVNGLLRAIPGRQVDPQAHAPATPASGGQAASGG